MNFGPKLLLLPKEKPRRTTLREGAPGAVEVPGAPGGEGSRRRRGRKGDEPPGWDYPTGRSGIGTWGLRCTGTGALWCGARSRTQGRYWWAKYRWHADSSGVWSIGQTLAGRGWCGGISGGQLLKGRFRGLGIVGPTLLFGREARWLETALVWIVIRALL